MEIFLLEVIAGDGHSNGLPDVDGLRPVKEYLPLGHGILWYSNMASWEIPKLID